MTVEQPELERPVLRVITPWWAWVLIGLGVLNLLAAAYVLTFVIGLQMALDEISRAAEEGGFFRGMDTLEEWLGRLGNFGR